MNEVPSYEDSRLLRQSCLCGTAMSLRGRLATSPTRGSRKPGSPSLAGSSAPRRRSSAQISAGVIVGGEFAGKSINRSGGVLWLAAEGENEIETGVRAAIAARGGDPDARHPFARQAEGVPCLTDKDALDRLKAMARQAASHMRSVFECDLVSIVVDTLSSAAGFDDENSASETQRVMNRSPRWRAKRRRSLSCLITMARLLTRAFADHRQRARPQTQFSRVWRSEPGNWRDQQSARSRHETAVGANRPRYPLSPRSADGWGNLHRRVVCRRAAPPPSKVKPWPKALAVFKRAFDEALGEFGKTTVPRRHARS